MSNMPAFGMPGPVELLVIFGVFVGVPALIVGIVLFAVGGRKTRLILGGVALLLLTLGVIATGLLMFLTYPVAVVE